MAAKETPIPFTVGDQERLVSIEAALAKIPGEIKSAVAGIKITHVCAQEGRITSLETSRDNWYKNIRKVVLTLMIGGILTIAGWLSYMMGLGPPPDGM